MSDVFRKEVAHRLVDQLSENSTLEDLVREIYVCEPIAKGLEDREAGKTHGCERGQTAVRAP
jgi:hypothetical protein